MNFVIVSMILLIILGLLFLFTWDMNRDAKHRRTTPPKRRATVESDLNPLLERIGNVYEYANVDIQIKIAYRYWQNEDQIVYTIMMDDSMIAEVTNVENVILTLLHVTNIDGDRL